jgi:hypothetical protein
LIVEQMLVLELPAPAAAPRRIRRTKQGRNDRNPGAGIAIAIAATLVLLLAKVAIIVIAIIAANVAFVIWIVRHTKIILDTISPPKKNSTVSRARFPLQRSAHTKDLATRNND